MKQFISFLTIWLLIACIPMLVITIVWIATLGSFDLITVIHDDGATASTIFFTICGGIGAGAFITEGE